MLNNVKPGDRAVIVRAPACPENIGAIVEVLHPYVQGTVLPGHIFQYETLQPPVLRWVLQSLGRPLLSRDNAGEIHSTMLHAVRDAHLRPLRDTDGTDEMVERVGTAPRHLTKWRHGVILSSLDAPIPSIRRHKVTNP